ncbi:MAG: hypothetical protein AABX51_02690 [Nanoarchaeota archaeon]
MEPISITIQKWIRESVLTYDGSFENNALIHKLNAQIFLVTTRIIKYSISSDQNKYRI